MNYILTGFVTQHQDFYIHIGDPNPDFIPDTWIQVTESISVDFPELNKNCVLNARIAKLDKQIESEKGKHYAEIKRLEQKKSELLAITYESCAVADALTDIDQLEDDYNDAN